MHDENLFILILYKQQLRSNFKAPSMHFKANLVYRVENEMETLSKNNRLVSALKTLKISSLAKSTY